MDIITIFIINYVIIVIDKMILILIGLFFNFLGTFVLIIETISGDSIRPKIYQNYLQKVHEINLDNSITRIKPNSKEIRVLIWLILICIGFLFQIFGYFIK